jgi:NAD(P)-dependent dehydrogenase (short-subunit alcohol dehydrogenase family)
MGSIETPAPSMSTLPQPGHNWQISVKDKVIASKICQYPVNSPLLTPFPVTGANQGIGLGLAEVCLANQAGCVYSFDISSPGDDFAALQKANPGRLEYIHVDVTSEESVTKAIDEVVAKSQRFDGMIANAGMTKHLPALEFTMEQVEKLFKLNVFGAWICATAAAKMFIKTKTKGSIVFTASMTSYRPNRVGYCSIPSQSIPFAFILVTDRRQIQAAPSAPYGATKAAVRNMTHTLAMEWAEHGIRVNSISPGYVKTALTYYVEKQPDWETKMKYYGGMPRLALPQELGGAYVYLLSDTATYTTGIDIPIAGIVGGW